MCMGVGVYTELGNQEYNIHAQSWMFAQKRTSRTQLASLAGHLSLQQAGDEG